MVGHTGHRYMVHFADFVRSIGNRYMGALLPSNLCLRPGLRLGTSLIKLKKRKSYKGRVAFKFLEKNQKPVPDI